MEHNGVPLRLYNRSAVYELRDLEHIDGSISRVDNLIGDIVTSCVVNLMIPVHRDHNKLVGERFGGSMVVPGFLCCNYTAHSLDAGSIRALCRYTECRVNTFDAVRDSLLHVLRKVDTFHSGGEYVSILGSMCRCSISAVEKIREALKGNHCMITMHNVDGIYVVSCHSGCIVRIVTGEHEDTMCHNLELRHGEKARFNIISSYNMIYARCC
jgi:hypothetical protein